MDCVPVFRGPWIDVEIRTSFQKDFVGYVVECAENNLLEVSIT